MSDHLILYVDRLISSPSDSDSSSSSSVTTVQSAPSASTSTPTLTLNDRIVKNGDEDEDGDDRTVENSSSVSEESPLIEGAECRICQEEDTLNNLETPCGCSGSLKYAHRKCVQHWCNEKGDITCEICHQPYQPGYTAPPRTEETAIDMEERWTFSGNPIDLGDPRLLAIAEAERRFLEAEYDDYSSNDSGAAFCRSAALILLALLLLRHALTITDPDGEDDASAFFSIFLLRAAGFLLPCYIMAWAISILQRRRQRQEAAALAATQVAFVLQSGQRRGLQIAIASGPPVTVTAQQEQPVV